MNDMTHPIEHEEVMAYVDGQVEAERAAAVAAHVEECAECQALAAELRNVSQQAAAWQVEAAPARLKNKVTAALPAQASKKRVFFLRPLVWQLGAVAALLLVVAAISIPNLLRSRMAYELAVPADSSRTETTAPAGGVQSQEKTLTRSLGTLPAGPMIIRTASLTVATKEFDNARAAMEQILRKHSGYIAELTTSGRAGAGRALTATIRVPAAQLDAALAELKKLGRVESETQGGEEVTERYVDLVARLTNARNTEKRLIEVLQNRTGKVKDVLEVEQEIARVREEIERMEAQRKNLENQVAFATVNLRLQEEYEAQVSPPRPSASMLLWNAAIEGYHSVQENALGLALFLLGWGPPMLFWLAVLFFPARLAWRRIRAATT